MANMVNEGQPRYPATVTTQVIAPSAIPTAEAFGVPAVAKFAGQVIAPVAIPTAEVFGVPTVALVAAQVIAPATIASEEAFGTPTVALVGVAGQTIAPVAIVSQESFGIPEVTLIPVGVVARLMREPGYFRAVLTSLHSPSTPAKVLARLEQFTDAEVTIPLNDAREAGLNLAYGHPLVDPLHRIVEHVAPYRVMLRLYYVAPPYGATLVFWGRLTAPEWDDQSDTVRLSAVDQGLALQHHYLRLGDQAINAADHPTLPNPWDRKVPLDHQGLRMLRDTGNNVDEQTARDVPDLGIKNGFNDVPALPASTKRAIRYDRGAEAWYTMREHVSHDGAPDMELEPIESHPWYARLNTYVEQGSDRPQVLWQDGFAKDNCTIRYAPGGRLVTLAHCLNSDKTQRVTVVDRDASEAYGMWVYWDVTNYESTDPDPLEDRGRQIVNAHAYPIDYFSIVPNPDCGLYYPRDFAVGSPGRGQIRRGGRTHDMQGRIVSVKLRQADDAGNVVPELETAVPGGAGVLGEET